jgi:hypothetical protein
VWDTILGKLVELGLTEAWAHVGNKKRDVRFALVEAAAALREGNSTGQSVKDDISCSDRTAPIS